MFPIHLGVPVAQRNGLGLLRERRRGLGGGSQDLDIRAARKEPGGDTRDMSPGRRVPSSSSSEVWEEGDVADIWTR
jgi:hypothetical protein